MPKVSHTIANSANIPKILYLCLIIARLSSAFRIPNPQCFIAPTLAHPFCKTDEKLDLSLHNSPRDLTSTAKESYLITTPLFYLNADPHIGHAYTLVASDVLKRYLLLTGHDAKLLVGTDEHGTKIKAASARLGQRPDEYVLAMRRKFTDVYRAYDISPDIVVHTSEESHKTRVKEAFQALLKSGHVYRGLHRGFFSPKEDLYYAKSKLVDGKSPLGFDVHPVEEPAYFFAMGKWRERLAEFLSSPGVVSPASRVNELKNILDTALFDVAITRSNCDWGVEIEGKETAYVWFDALMGYLAPWAAGAAPGPPDRKVVHVLGKDILAFHGLLWPAMLMALHLPLPSRLLVHGWILSRGAKMSKSLGNHVPALPLSQSSDVARFALANLGDFSDDFEFDPSVFDTALGLLRNRFANTCHRITAVLAAKGVATLSPPRPEDSPSPLFATFARYASDIDGYVSSFRLDKYIQVLVDMTSELNRFLDERRFRLLDPGSAQFLDTAWTSCSLLLTIAVYLSPVTPNLASAILARLNPALAGTPVTAPSLGAVAGIHHVSFSPVHLGHLI